MSRKRRTRDVVEHSRRDVVDRRLAEDLVDARSRLARLFSATRSVSGIAKRRTVERVRAAVDRGIRRGAKSLPRAALGRPRISPLSVSHKYLSTSAHDSKRQVVNCLKGKLEEYRERPRRGKRRGSSRGETRRRIFQAARKDC